MGVIIIIPILEGCYVKCIALDTKSLLYLQVLETHKALPNIQKWEKRERVHACMCTHKNRGQNVEQERRQLKK